MKNSLITILMYLCVFYPAISADTNYHINTSLNDSVIDLPVTDSGLVITGLKGQLSDYTLGASEIGTKVSMDLFSNMEGSVPGMDVTPVGAEPGAYVRMLIRGIGSVNGGNDPLIVIDGVPFENSTLNAAGYRFSGLGELDADDFESVTVLKGAASTALYGARGANGVILINTKEGLRNKKEINLSYRQGVSSSPRQLELLDADQYMTVLNNAYKNSFPAAEGQAPINQHAFNGFYATPYTDTEGNVFQPNLASTNWYDNMHMQGVNHYVRASMRGGDNTTQYFIGGTYRYDESFLYAGAHDRANFRLNLVNQTNQRLKLGLNLFISTNRRDVNSRQWFEASQTTALPVYPVMSPENPAMFWFNENYQANIEALNQYSWNKTGGMRTFNSGFAEYTLLEGLSLKSQWSWDFQHYLNENYRHPYVAPTANGLLIIGRYDRSNWTGNNSINFSRSFGEHSIDAVGGFSLENYTWTGNTIYNPGMTLIFVHSNGESNQTRLAWTHVENYRFYSGYGKMTYNYGQRYEANLSLRSDASSRFGTENRMHHFPAVSLAWNLSNEDFAQNIDLINYMQLYAGYGIVGNAQMGNFLHKSSLGPTSQNDPNAVSQGYYRYGLYPAVIPVNMGNAFLGPEKSAQLDLGLNFAILQNRLAGKVGYFSYRNFDLLNSVPVSMLYGYENTNRWENDGEMTTSGLELFLSPRIISTSNGLNWSMDFNIASIKTTLTKLPERLEYIEGYFNRTYEGDALGGYYVADWAGVDPGTGHEMIFDPQTGEQVNAEMLTDAEFKGMASYFSDKTPFPDFYGGVRNNLSYRNFDFSFLFTFKQGHYLLDLGQQSLSYIGSGSTATVDLNNGWTSENPTNTPLLYNTSMSKRVTSRFLHDASYVRLQEVALSYTLPKSIAGWNYDKDVKIYFIGNNLMTFTDFPGYDPNGIFSSYNSMSNLDAGLVMFDPPAPRTIMFGISLGL